MVDIPPIPDGAPLTVASVMHLTMYANSCVLWISASGVFMGCLFVRLLKPMGTFRRFHVYLRVVELAFDQFKDFAILFIALLVAGSLGYSFVCQGIGGGTGFSTYLAAVNSWSLYVMGFYRYEEFSQGHSWVGFGIPALGIIFFWAGVILCVIFCQARDDAPSRDCSLA